QLCAARHLRFVASPNFLNSTVFNDEDNILHRLSACRIDHRASFNRRRSHSTSLSKSSNTVQPPRASERGHVRDSAGIGLFQELGIDIACPVDGRVEQL